MDEATALAAGHRPCAECRRDSYNAFKAAWLAANGHLVGDSKAIADIDAILHRERAATGGGKVTHIAPNGELPAGVMIELDGQACLVWRGGLHRWSFGGYTKLKTAPGLDKDVTVLTPASIVAAIGQGFVPQAHLSAFS